MNEMRMTWTTEILSKRRETNDPIMIKCISAAPHYEVRRSNIDTFSDRVFGSSVSQKAS